MIKVDISGFKPDFTKLDAALTEINNSEMIGWINPEKAAPTKLIEEILAVATEINKKADFLVCVGIGGSYLGHKALVEALEPKNADKILYAGQNLDTKSLQKVLRAIENHDFCLNIISKSGTTLEPSIAFRILKTKLIKKYGATEAARRIYATTDANHGVLHDEAVKNGYRRFVVPDNIGGRYSVLSAVGLLPLAVAGVDIKKLVEGAGEIARQCGISTDTNNVYGDLGLSAKLGPGAKFTKTPLGKAVATYALARDFYRQKNYDTEILATFRADLWSLTEWWKQLFGESEGKAGRGVLPAAVTYTTDLHSLGQFLQDGRRNLWETVLRIDNKSSDDFDSMVVSGLNEPENSASATTSDSNEPEKIIFIKTPEDDDGLNYLAGKTLEEINSVAGAATIAAHRAGGIPVIELILETLDEKNLGELVWFFEMSCAISATLDKVNPFDQPGVEAYKQNMQKLLREN